MEAMYFSTYDMRMKLEKEIIVIDFVRGECFQEAKTLPENRLQFKNGDRKIQKKGTNRNLLPRRIPENNPLNTKEFSRIWRHRDSNPGHADYDSAALTN